MNIHRKIALSIAGAAIVAGSAFGVVTASHAGTPTPTPTPGPSATQPYGPRDDNPGRMGRGGAGMGRMAPMAGQGAGYGAQDQAGYLAGKLGVQEDTVAKALADYRATRTNQVRGRDMDDAARAADHDRLAGYLAEQLKLDKAKVLTALDGMQEARQAERTEQLKTRLDAAVKDGRISQADQDAILKAHSAGVMGGFGHGRR